MATSDPIIIRKARLSDIGELCDLFLDLSPTVKRFFHPFQFNKIISKTWFLMMVISQKMLTVLKKKLFQSWHLFY